MRLRMTESRERRLDDLQEALDEKTKSKAIDKAATFTVRMRGGCSGVPQGQIAELMKLAEELESVTPEHIADVLDIQEVPLGCETRWNVGENPESVVGCCLMGVVELLF